jgi:hypothetical protein
VGFPVPLETFWAVRQLEIDTARACLIVKRVLVRVDTLFTAEPPHHPHEVHHGRTGTMPQVWRPDESVPSIPQRRACSVFNSGVDRHFRFAISTSLPARGDDRARVGGYSSENALRRAPLHRAEMTRFDPLL